MALLTADVLSGTDSVVVAGPDGSEPRVIASRKEPQMYISLARVLPQTFVRCGCPMASPSWSLVGMTRATSSLSPLMQRAGAESTLPIRDSRDWFPGMGMALAPDGRSLYRDPSPGRRATAALRCAAAIDRVHAAYQQSARIRRRQHGGGPCRHGPAGNAVESLGNGCAGRRRTPGGSRRAHGTGAVGPRLGRRAACDRRCGPRWRTRLVVDRRHDRNLPVPRSGRASAVDERGQKDARLLAGHHRPRMVRVAIQ